MRSLHLSLMASALLVGLASAPAFAQSLEFGRGGVRIDPGYRYYDDRRDFGRREFDGIGRREAIRAARGAGLVEIEEVYQTGRVWRVEGVDRRGRDRTVVVHGRTGEVLSVTR